MQISTCFFITSMLTRQNSAKTTKKPGKRQKLNYRATGELLAGSGIFQRFQDLVGIGSGLDQIDSSAIDLTSDLYL